jgi:hypothetical protein
MNVLVGMARMFSFFRCGRGMIRQVGLRSLYGYGIFARPFRNRETLPEKARDESDRGHVLDGAYPTPTGKNRQAQYI